VVVVRKRDRFSEESFLDMLDRVMEAAAGAQDGSPADREAAIRAFQDRLWRVLPQVADALIELSFGAESEAVRIKALEILTNRLMGTPKQAIELEARVPPSVQALREAMERARELGVEVVKALPVGVDAE
jgi:hypothetical protein